MHHGRRERDASLDFTLCLICQKPKKKKNKNIPTRKVSLQGLQKLEFSINERTKYHDTDFIDTLDSLSSVDLNDHVHEVQWHRDCYATFTHVDHIRRLKKINKQTIKSKKTFQIHLPEGGVARRL